MSSIIGNSINSAIVSGQFGLQNAYQGMTQASMNIAQRAAQDSVASSGPQEMLASASLQSLQNLKNTLPGGSGGPINDLVSLKMHSINAQASAKVMDVAFDTVGSIIDTLA